MVYNFPAKSTAQVTIGANHTHNTTDTPFDNNCDQEKNVEM